MRISQDHHCSPVQMNRVPHSVPLLDLSAAFHQTYTVGNMSWKTTNSVLNWLDCPTFNCTCLNNFKSFSVFNSKLKLKDPLKRWVLTGSSIPAHNLRVVQVFFLCILWLTISPKYDPHAACLGQGAWWKVTIRLKDLGYQGISLYTYTYWPHFYASLLGININM